MTDVLNPVQIEQLIRNVAERIAKGVRACSGRYEAFLTAERKYDAAFAAAYMDHDGPAHEKRHAAELVTTDIRADRDVADAAYRYADRQAKALEAELRAYQSVGASVRQMYATAGRGEG